MISTKLDLPYLGNDILAKYSDEHSDIIGMSIHHFIIGEVCKGILIESDTIWFETWKFFLLKLFASDIFQSILKTESDTIFRGTIEITFTLDVTLLMSTKVKVPDEIFFRCTFRHRREIHCVISIDTGFRTWHDSNVLRTDKTYQSVNMISQC